MIGITGATGHLGRLVIEDLLARGVAPSEIVALARSPDKAQQLAERGVQVRRADYTQPETLSTALQGVDRLLFISSSAVREQRAAEHRNVVEAARAAGLELLVYTSILNADSGKTELAGMHRATEELIREAGLPFVFLRNGWYLENYTENLAPALEHGALLGAAEQGRVSAASRADYAAAAAAVLTGSGHENQIYELGGDQSFTLAELAEEVSRQSGKPVEYRNLPEEEYAGFLASVGVPEGFARVLADSDRGVARGELVTDRDDLRRLIGRPTTPLRDAVAVALKG